MRTQIRLTSKTEAKFRTCSASLWIRKVKERLGEMFESIFVFDRGPSLRYISDGSLSTFWEIRYLAKNNGYSNKIGLLHFTSGGLTTVYVRVFSAVTLRHHSLQISKQTCLCMHFFCNMLAIKLGRITRCTDVDVDSVRWLWAGTSNTLVFDL